MNNRLSACCFIRNNNVGFGLWEAMCSYLHLVTEYIVLDLGSTDGTYETLKEIAAKNSKVKVFKGEFKEINAYVFATLANDLIAECKSENVLYHQSDEIMHQDLIRRLEAEFQKGNYDHSFWRYQLRSNFQKIRQLPQRVHRVGPKSNFNFCWEGSDGMNSDRVNEVPICSAFDGGFYMKWGEVWGIERADKLPAWDMILDISLLGGFRDNIPERKRLHSPFWNDGLDLPAWRDGVEGRIPMEVWIEEENKNPDWTKKTTPFDIPKIMEYHLGETRYKQRGQLIEALKYDKTRELIGL